MECKVCKDKGELEIWTNGTNESKIVLCPICKGVRKTRIVPTHFIEVYSDGKVTYSMKESEIEYLDMYLNDTSEMSSLETIAIWKIKQK